MTPEIEVRWGVLGCIVEVWEAFKIFDADGSGTVTKSELCKLLTSGRTSDKSKQDKESKAIEVFLDSYDTSGDGVVDFDEFMEMLDESHARGKSKQARTTSNLESAETSADNSYFGFCTNIAGAAGEKEQVTPSVTSRQAIRRSTRKMRDGLGLIASFHNGCCSMPSEKSVLCKLRLSSKRACLQEA